MSEDASWGQKRNASSNRQGKGERTSRYFELIQPTRDGLITPQGAKGMGIFDCTVRELLEYKEGSENWRRAIVVPIFCLKKSKTWIQETSDQSS